MTGFEIIVIILLLVICGLLWFNLRDKEDRLTYLRSINEYLRLIKEKKWVIFVINVNIHLRLYGDVNITIIKNGFLFVTTVLKRSEFLILDLLVRLKISKEW